jgi:hypothetical protein
MHLQVQVQQQQQQQQQQGVGGCLDKLSCNVTKASGWCQ